MNKPSACRYCEAEIVLARTRSGYWKALNPEPIATRQAAEFGERLDTWLVDRKTRLLVAVRDVTEPPFWAYLEHKCAEYLEARTIAPIPALGEQGFNKVSDSPELVALMVEIETRETVKQAKEARKVREKLTKRERLDVK